MSRQPPIWYNQLSVNKCTFLCHDLLLLLSQVKTHIPIPLFRWVSSLIMCAGPCKTILTGRLRTVSGSAVEGSPSPSPSCLWFGKAACVPPGRLTELPLVKLYLVFLFHLPIDSLSVNDPPDVLDRQKCLTALASLRHAKWFQVWILSFCL